MNEKQGGNEGGSRGQWMKVASLLLLTMPSDLGRSEVLACSGGLALVFRDLVIGVAHGPSLSILGLPDQRWLEMLETEV